MSKTVKINDFKRFKKKGKKIVAITCYDYSSAKIIDTCDIDIVLVGDSLGMVVLGYDSTLSVTMEDMLHHLKAVTRGIKRAFVVCDMPFMSYQADFKDAIYNAGKLVKEGRAQAVKIEGANEHNLKVISHLTDIGIPVMGHLGFTPQSVNTIGGNLVQAKTAQAIEQIVQDAQKLEKSGVFSIVLEMVPMQIAQIITNSISIPTIGIGAGLNVDGQILVLEDLLGKFSDFCPKFVRKYANLDEIIKSSVNKYAQEVMSQDFPSEKESFSVDTTNDTTQNLALYGSFN